MPQYIADIEPVVLYPSRWKLAGLTLLGLGLSAVAIGITLRADLFPVRPWHLPVIWVGACFFPACTLYGLIRLLRRRPCLVIDERGITDRASATSFGFVGWDEIVGFRCVEFSKQKFLVVEPVHTDEILERLPRWKRWVKRMDIALLGSPICMPQSMLPMPVDELCQAMARIRQTQTSKPDHGEREAT